MTLKDLEIGSSAVIASVGGEGALRQHFLDMGVIPGAEIKLVKLAPMGDPMEFQIHGYELTLRVADAEKIEIKNNTIKTSKKDTENHGFGIGNIKRTAQKYDGFVTLNCTDTEFSLKTGLLFQ